ncbi:MAG: PilT/PilU family type 4a pilus ATPase [Pyrinomonadaceae bacterium]
MEKLNFYLKQLLSSCSEELRIEPDKIPYLVANNRNEDVGNVALLGTQISMMIFPMIPNEAKVKLPNSDEIDFTHTHELGNFHFTVQKSPAGFIVAVRPVIGETSAGSVRVEQPQPDAAPVESKPEPVAEPAPEFQSAQSPAPKYEPAAYSFESTSGVQDMTDDGAIDAAKFQDLSEKPAAAYIQPVEPQVERLSANNEPASQPVITEPKIDYPLRRKTDFIPDESANNMNSYQQTSTSPSTPAFTPAEANSAMTAKMDELFKQMAEIGASDLHLSVSMPPLVRKDGKIQTLGDGDTLSADAMRDLLTSIMPAKNQEEFARRHDTDFAYEIADLARFRCNVFMDRKGMGGVFRIIPAKMTTAEQLGLSSAILDLCNLSKGLVVVTGPTGSGKSTTLCAMVNHINQQREDHIITIEDPIEFVHDNIKCLVNQREVHNHTDSFKDALRAALREDPDILLVGEMRDLETVSIAIETAETGHLVFGTLHTTTASSTVDRIIDQFPADRQQQIRVMLSESLKGVIAQTLLPKKGGGRVAALEILIVTPAISNLIREGKTFQIPSAMQTGKNHGMVMLNDALFELVKNGTVEPKDAYIKAVDKTGFETMLGRGGFKI